MNNGLEIAIIGAAGRFPGAKNITEFWHNLQQGIESIHSYTEEELNDFGINRENNPDFVNADGKLDDIDLFAAEFFGFNPKEAELLDPQHRLFLECAWTALENAGYDGEQYAGDIGVFGGAAMNGYMLNLYSNPDVRDSVNKYQLFLASEKDFLTTRVSYKLGLQGSSVNVQTACSTSLVAVHLACQSLLSGECDMALAGGVAISISPGYIYQQGGIYSPDGHCRAFAEDARGTVGGSGVGIVVLKRLEDANCDKDNVLAVIKGSAINNDGALKVSYTAPRIDTQEKVIRSAQLVAEIEPETISYIETHGTGTQLGDPIEIAALTQAFQTGTGDSRIPPTQFCAIGSIKPNIGHLDTAAGIASLIKTVLALQHKQIPPSINCDIPNPQIDWVNSPFYVNNQLKAWSSDDNTRRAGVSSFGIGGTNVHVVLEEAGRVAEQGEQGEQGEQLLLLSAKTSTALDMATQNLAHHLQENPDLDLAEVAYTLQVGRRAFNHRRIVVATDAKDAAESLKNIDPQRVFTGNIEPGYKPVIFMFSGQGSQYPDMAYGLYQNEPVFKEQCDRAFNILQQYLDTSIKEIIFPPAPVTPPASPASLITQTQYAQPALFVIEYALAQLLMSWGIKPEATIGHSIGEYVSATLAGVFSLETALKLVVTRGKLMQQQPSGVMLSVALSELELQSYLSDEVSLAACNAPSLSVVSGRSNAIANLEVILAEKGIACRRLKTSHAFHSHLMDGAILPFIEAVKEVKLSPPKIPFISGVTGTWITSTEATNPEYWGQQIREAVQFTKGITEIAREPNRILLEVGAGRTLSTLAKQTAKQNTILASIRHPKDNSLGDRAFLLNTCGQLWLSGVKLDWSKLYHKIPGRIPLPTYPFERQRYWIEAPSEITQTVITKQESHLDEWFYRPCWIRDLPLPILDSADLAQSKSSWLILQDGLGIGENIAGELLETEHQVISVIQGEEFKINSERSLTIASNKSDDYQALLEYVATQNYIPKQIVYLWNIVENDSINSEFEKLLFLIRALEKQRFDSSIQINIITTNLGDVTGEHTLISEKFIISGITKVINQEYADFNCRVIDLPTPINKLNQIENNIITECLSSSQHSVRAYRNNYPWNLSYQPYKINNQQSRLKKEGVYLIIGSIAGSLALVWAEYLVENFQAKIVLIGNSDELENIENTKYLTIDTDISDEAAVNSAISQAEKHFERIDGIFYATPMTNKNSASLISEMNPSHWEYNYQTKILPLNILGNCLKNKQLDFVCVQSSLSSILGGLGLAAYASANSYLDAFVELQNKNANKTPWFSINWDACQTAEAKAKNTGFGASLAEFSLTPQQIGEATNKILGMNCGSQIIVSKGNLQQRIERWVQPISSSESDSNTNTKLYTAAKHSRPNLANEYVPPSNETEEKITHIWQQVLGIDKVGIHDSFFDLGGHSLLAIQTISRLRETFQIELPMSSILADTPTVASLADTIIQKQPQEAELAIIGELLAEVSNMSPEEIEAFNHK